MVRFGMAMAKKERNKASVVNGSKHTQPFYCRKFVMFSKHEIHLEYTAERIHLVHHSIDTASLYLLDAFRCVLIQIYKSPTQCTYLVY